MPDAGSPQGQGRTCSASRGTRLSQGSPCGRGGWSAGQPVCQASRSYFQLGLRYQGRAAQACRVPRPHGTGFLSSTLQAALGLQFRPPPSGHEGVGSEGHLRKDGASVLGEGVGCQWRPERCPWRVPIPVIHTPYPLPTPALLQRTSDPPPPSVAGGAHGQQYLRVHPPFRPRRDDRCPCSPPASSPPPAPRYLFPSDKKKAEQKQGDALGCGPVS